jgi:hypothetical protein
MSIENYLNPNLQAGLVLLNEWKNIDCEKFLQCKLMQTSMV